MRQCEFHDDVLDQRILIRSGTQMLKSCRGPVEQTLHADLRALIRRIRLCRFQFSILHLHPGGIRAITRHQRQLRHTGNTRKRFAPEAERTDIPEVILPSDLGSRMPAEAVHGILAVHAAAIVADCDPIDAAILCRNRNPRGTCINRVFHKFLDDSHRPLHHFSGSDHIGSLCIQLMYSSHK